MDKEYKADQTCNRSLTPSPSSCQNTSKCQSALHHTNVELCRNWVNFATWNKPTS